jgi:hypothetical protein
MDAQAALQALLKLAQRDPRRDDEVVISGQAPVLPTNFLLGTAGAAVIAAVAVAAADLWYLRTGRRQPVAVDMRAAAAALRSDRYLLIDGKAPPVRGTLFRDSTAPVTRAGFSSTAIFRIIAMACSPFSAASTKARRWRLPPDVCNMWHRRYGCRKHLPIGRGRRLPMGCTTRSGRRER